VYFAARSTGRSSEAAVEIERALLFPWLTARLGDA